MDGLAIIRFVDATAACVNALGVLAAPILYTRRRKDAERRRTVLDLVPTFDAFLELVPEIPASERAEVQLAALIEQVTTLRGKLAALPHPHDVDRALMEEARRVLAAYGVAPPAGGWDRWTGAL